MRKVDTNKKSNIKCEHCKFYKGKIVGECLKDNSKKNYYNRCKGFDWKEFKKLNSEQKND